MKDLATELLQHFPRLDEAGRYEVLVYGVHYELPSYAPLFQQVLERPDPARVERSDLLALLYADRVPSASSGRGSRRDR